jgi:iron(III) transport system ATP-binding protein
MTILALDSVSVRHGTSTVLDGLSLVVDHGEVVAVLGPSGAGKSTMLRVLLGLVAPERGTVSIRGRVASADGRIVLAPEERGLAMVFQDLALWPHMTVAKNLRFALRSQRVPRDQEQQRIERMLGRVGLSRMAGRYPGELSGGEQQRVAIARALVLEPSAVLLDEPLANLDVALSRELLDLFRELIAERRTTAVYVTHEPREAARLAARLAVLEGGRVVQQGSLEQLRLHPATSFVERMLEPI